MFKKTLSLLISLSFIFETTGFAQVASNPDLSGMLTGMFSQQESFRPLHFRSLSFDRASGNFEVYADKGDANLTSARIKQDSGKLFDYFLTGLAVPNSAFWVNLRPDRPEMVIDPLLDTTDCGKVLLEADLQLKKDLAKFTSPDNNLGREYWNKLYAKAETIFGVSSVTLPTLTRPWIVPGEIILCESSTGAYIYKATLKVMLEQDRLTNSASYNFDDSRLKELNDYSSQLIRQIIIPKLTKEVNSAPRYASLRQVFYSLILAQWFKKHFNTSAGAYGSRIDSKDLSGLASQAAWNKNTYFQAYKNSFDKGEYNIQETVARTDSASVRRYFSGGFTMGADVLAEASTLPVSAIDQKIIGPNLAELNFSAKNINLVNVDLPIPEIKPVPAKDGGDKITTDKQVIKLGGYTYGPKEEHLRNEIVKEKVDRAADQRRRGFNADSNSEAKAIIEGLEHALFVGEKGGEYPGQGMGHRQAIAQELKDRQEALRQGKEFVVFVRKDGGDKIATDKQFIKLGDYDYSNPKVQQVREDCVKEEVARAEDARNHGRNAEMNSEARAIISGLETALFVGEKGGDYARRSERQAIEQELADRKEALRQGKEFVVFVRKDGGSFSSDWNKLVEEGSIGFTRPTNIYLALFSSEQKKAFTQFFKNYPLPKNVRLDPDTMTFDIQSPKKDVSVYGNGLGVLTTVYQFAANLIKQNGWKENINLKQYLLDNIKNGNPDHVVVITAGGKAQRNPKYSEIGKCQATLPIQSAKGPQAADMNEMLCHIGSVIEQNYANDFMFSVIYGDALISMNTADLRTALSDENVRKGLCCILLKMDYREAPKYGFAKVDGTGKIERFQEKYTDKERTEAAFHRTAFLEASRDPDSHTAKDLEIYKEATNDEALMKAWLKENGYLIDDKYILMNPAFSVLGLDAFLGYARLAGIIDENNILRVKDMLETKEGNYALDKSSYLNRALEGEFGAKREIDNYGHIVAAFASAENHNPTELDKIITAMGRKGILYGVQVRGAWYDTGASKLERDITLQEDEFKEIRETFGLKKWINSTAVFQDKPLVEPFFAYNSRVQFKRGGLHPRALVTDSFVDVDKIRIESGAQLYNVLLNGFPELRVINDHIFVMATVARDEKDYVVPIIWDINLDNVKEPLYASVKLQEWSAESGLGLDVKSDLFATRMFPMISAKLLNSGKYEDRADDFDWQIYQALPQILGFLQRRLTVSPAELKKYLGKKAEMQNDKARKWAIDDIQKELTKEFGVIVEPAADAPDIYVEAIKKGLVASFEDTYKSPAAQELVAMRKDIADKAAAARDGGATGNVPSNLVKSVLRVDTYEEYAAQFGQRVAANGGLQATISKDCDEYLRLANELRKMKVQDSKLLSYTYDPTEDIGSPIELQVNGELMFQIGESASRDNRPGGAKPRQIEPAFKPYDSLVPDELRDLANLQPSKIIGKKKIDVYGGKKEIWITTNAFPLSRRHFQLVEPDNIAQQLPADFLRASLEIMKDLSDFTGYFNSSGANCSLNHPHIQFIPNLKAGAFDKMTISWMPQKDNEPMISSRYGKIRLGTVVNDSSFAANFFVFEAGEDGFDQLAQFIQEFQQQLFKLNIPHNMVFKTLRQADNSAVIRIYVAPHGPLSVGKFGQSFAGAEYAGFIVMTATELRFAPFCYMMPQPKSGKTWAEEVNRIKTDLKVAADAKDTAREKMLRDELQQFVGAVLANIETNPETWVKYIQQAYRDNNLDAKTFRGLEQWIEAQKAAPATKDGGKGGVDFAAMPMATIGMNQLPPVSSGMAQVNIAALSAQLQQLKKQLRLGKMPCAELKEFLKTAKSGKDTEELLSVCAYCVAEVLRKEEEAADPTSNEMKQILAYLFN
jgi:hypothetical protein